MLLIVPTDRYDTGRIAKKRIIIAAAVLCLLMLRVNAASSQVSIQSVTRYAIIVANNQSMDEGVEPLRYADDDGARYFELFKAAGANVTLLAVLDRDAQLRYPDVTKVAIPPVIRTFRQTIHRVFSKIKSDVESGKNVHFYFIYAGHGNVGPNQEGYFNLLDYRFGRTELYREIVAKSPATFNHLILDACQSYFMVNKRGGRSDKKRNYRKDVTSYLEEETLAQYPNTGVLLAASSESETHEWSQFEAGVFSHEIRSALLGGGDVNNDDHVTYNEVAAFVKAANAAVTIPRAQLKVYYHAPTQRVDVPLLDMAAFQNTPTLTMPAPMSNRYYVEDARGVRILDLHYSSEQSVTVKLVGDAPYYIRQHQKEAILDSKSTQFDLSELTFLPMSVDQRGSVSQTYRNHLFEIPFGIGFYRGVSTQLSDVTIRGEFKLVADNDVRTDITDYGNEDSFSNAKSIQNNMTHRRIFGFSTLGAGFVIGATAGILYYMARKDWATYERTTDRDTALSLKESSHNLLQASRVTAVAGIGLTVLGSGILIGNLVKKNRRRKDTSRFYANPIAGAGKDAIFLGIAGQF